MTLDNLELFLPSFLKLFPPETVHIHGGSSFVGELLPVFDAAEEIILTNHQIPKNNTLDDNITVLKHAVFSNAEKEAMFYHLSLESMSGLVSAQQLSVFWKNIKNKREELVQTMTLEGFYSDFSEDIEGLVNWFCLDGFQAYEILQGAGDEIDNYQGIILRVLVQEDIAPASLECSASKIDHFLNGYSFIRIANFEARHPAFEYFLYIRDLKQDLDRMDELLTINQEKCDNLTSEKSALEIENVKSAQKILQLQSAIADVKEVSKQSKVLSEIVSKTQKEFDKKLEVSLTLLKQNSERGIANSRSIEKITNLELLLSEIKELSSNTNALGEAASITQVKFSEKFEASLAIVKENRQQTFEGIAKLEQLLSELKEASSASKVQGKAVSLTQTELSEKFQLALNLLKENNQQKSNQEEALEFLKTEFSKISDMSELLKDIRFHNFLRGHSDKDLIANIWTHMGEASYGSHKFEQASEYFQLALDAGGEKAWCKHGMAESMARHNVQADKFWYVPEQKSRIDEFGRWDAVVRLYRQALSLDPNIGRSFSERFPPKALAMSDNPIENPIYIVGCGHSGTSILLRIIGNHKNIWPVKKESAFFLKPDTHLSALLKEWDENCVGDSRARWVEKTPPHIFQIPRLLASRPNAKILLITRDGRDVVASLKHRKGYESIDDRIDRWLYDNMAGLPFWDHERVHILTYENLVSKSEETLKKVFNFLGEEYDEGVLDFHQSKENWYTDELRKPKSIQNNQDHNHLRNWQVNQPLFDGRGAWKKSMTKNELKTFETRCADLMAKLGYGLGN